MFIKFLIKDISLNSFNKSEVHEFVKTGGEIYSSFRKKIHPSLDKYIKENGHIDANQLRGEWFPEVPADIFLSHSHADEQTALALAGFLHKNFNVNVFIDSTIWKNIADLQRLVDEPLRFYPNGRYNYDKRNQSTAYVHLLLSTALTKMMDNSEAIFFLSTEKSLSSNEQNITESVWIYHELFTSQFLRLKSPERYNRIQKSFSGGIMEARVEDGFKMDFKVNLNDFKILDPDRINKWIKSYHPSYSQDINALDMLYSLYKE